MPDSLERVLIEVFEKVHEQLVRQHPQGSGRFSRPGALREILVSQRLDAERMGRNPTAHPPYLELSGLHRGRH